MHIYIYIYIYLYSDPISPEAEAGRPSPELRPAPGLPPAGLSERLAEYGRKPHRTCGARNKNNYRLQFTGIWIKNRGVRFHRIRDFKQYYFNSIPPTSH